MKQILKFSEWQGGADEWRCADTTTWTGWWYPARMLNISVTDYILLLKNKYHAENFYYIKDKNLLIWSWTNYNDCHAFVLFINKEARQRKFYV